MQTHDYASLMLEFREWCEQRKLNFRQTIADLVTRRMGRKPRIVIARRPRKRKD